MTTGTYTVSVTASFPNSPNLENIAEFLAQAEAHGIPKTAVPEVEVLNVQGSDKEYRLRKLTVSGPAKDLR
jgi:hypothetical protein